MAVDEFQLLLTCLRARLRNSPDAVRACALKSSFDWDRFLRLAHRHKLIPLTAESINEARIAPEAVARQLACLQQTVLFDNLQLARCLLELAGEFRSAGIPFLSFKGPTLAMQLHGELGKRQFNDVDILVRREDLRAVLDVLAQIGFSAEGSPVGELSDARLRTFTHRFHEQTFLRPTGNTVTKVDVHWRYADDPAFVAAPREEVFHQQNGCHIGREFIPTLPFQANLIYVAFHAVNHQCMRLTWLYDFGLAIQQLPHSEWPVFLNSLPPTERRIVISALLLLEEFELMESPENLVGHLNRWRRELRTVVDAMRHAATAEQAALLLGAGKNALWRWQLTGRIRPGLWCLVKSLLPGPADLLQPGPLGPPVSRMRYLAGQLRWENSAGSNAVESAAAMDSGDRHSAATLKFADHTSTKQPQNTSGETQNDAGRSNAA